VARGLGLERERLTYDISLVAGSFRSDSSALSVDTATDLSLVCSTVGVGRCYRGKEMPNAPIVDKRNDHISMVIR
jgi:hypothetical protein